MKYHRKPVPDIVFEAEQLTGFNSPVGFIEWGRGHSAHDGSAGYVDTKEFGPLHAKRGDWILTYADGEHGVCEDGMFQRVYEPVQ